jgi:hypothetical protein
MTVHTVQNEGYVARFGLIYFYSNKTSFRASIDDPKVVLKIDKGLDGKRL